MHAEDETLKAPALQNTGQEPLNSITFSMYHPTLRALHYGLFGLLALVYLWLTVSISLSNRHILTNPSACLGIFLPGLVAGALIYLAVRQRLCTISYDSQTL